VSRLRKAAKAAVVTQIFNSVGLLLSLVTVPLYLLSLGQERYGLLLTGLAVSSYLQFSDAGINWGSMILMAQANGRGDRSGIASILRTSIPLAACSAIIVIILIAGLYLALNIPRGLSWVPAHSEFPGLLIAIGAAVVITLGTSPFYNLFSALQETHLVAIYQGSGRIVGTLASVAIASTGAPLGWVFGGNAACAFLVGLIVSVHCRRRHPWAFQRGRFWDPVQVRQQLRTGAKSLVMQIGAVLSGSAPIFAISFAAGPQFVPYYSIPLTLLHAPCGVISSFSTSLQGGYGEAMGRGETQWIAETVRQIVRQVIVILCLLGCGFLLLAGPFIHLWTGGKIELSSAMSIGVLALAGIGTILTIFRYALTGINRHRVTSFSDLLGGILSMGIAIVVVRSYGYEWGALAVAGVALVNSGWLLPHELKRALGATELWPPMGFWIRWIVVGIGTFTAGWAILEWFDFTHGWLLITLCGVTTTLAFGLLLRLFLRADTVSPRRWIPFSSTLKQRLPNLDENSPSSLPPTQ